MNEIIAQFSFVAEILYACQFFMSLSFSLFHDKCVTSFLCIKLDYIFLNKFPGKSPICEKMQMENQAIKEIVT